jgi:hypothetical protein
MYHITFGIVMVLLLAVSESWGEGSSEKTTDQDGRGVIQHGTIPSHQFTIPADRNAFAGSESLPKLGTVPEPISPTPILPFGPHAPMMTPGAPKAPAVAPPSSGGFSTGTWSR